MIAENLSHDSYVEIDGPYDNLPGVEYVDIEYDIFEDQPIRPGVKATHKVKIGTKICRFFQPDDGSKSLLPRTLQKLLKARKDTRKEQKKFPKGSFEWNVKEGLQLAYKITANSLYGQVGAKTSPIFLKEIAACTTASGRKLIYFSKDFVLNNYPNSEIIYGDTDSIFAKFDTKNSRGEQLYGLDGVSKSIELCVEASLAISRQLKPPHNLEFEKAIFPFMLLSKKRYHGHYYTQYASDKYYANSMGIVLKRRDNADIVKYVFRGILDIIMKEHDINKAMERGKVMFKEVLEGNFPLDQFVITKTLKSYYKNPDQIAHNVLAQRIGERDPGNKPQSNDRLPYAYIKVPALKKGEKMLQGNRIETPEFIKDHNQQIDYKFYLTNQIMKPVSQIFELVMDNVAELFFEALMEYDRKQTGIQRISKWHMPGTPEYIKYRNEQIAKFKATYDEIMKEADDDDDVKLGDEILEV
jgi:DNA polymerase elongation subunit (family B)